MLSVTCVNHGFVCIFSLGIFLFNDIFKKLGGSSCVWCVFAKLFVILTWLVQVIYSFFLSKSCPLGMGAMLVVHKRLYTPTSWWQLGQEWVTSLNMSTQNGIRQQPATPLEVKERSISSVKIEYVPFYVAQNKQKWCLDIHNNEATFVISLRFFSFLSSFLPSILSRRSHAFQTSKNCSDTARIFKEFSLFHTEV